MNGIALEYPHLEENFLPPDTSTIVQDSDIRLPYRPVLLAGLIVQVHTAREKTRVIPPYPRQRALENPADSAAPVANSLPVLGL